MNFSELAEEVSGVGEKLITENAESDVALSEARRLDYCHRLERERIHFLLFEEAAKGLDDVTAGRVKDARSLIQVMKYHHSG